MGVGTGATVTRKVDGLKGLAERLKNAKKMEVAVGFPKDMGNAYPDGTPVVEVAAAHAAARHLRAARVGWPAARASGRCRRPGAVVGAARALQFGGGPDIVATGASVGNATAH